MLDLRSLYNLIWVTSGWQHSLPMPYGIKQKKVPPEKVCVLQNMRVVLWRVSISLSSGHPGIHCTKTFVENKFWWKSNGQVQHLNEEIVKVLGSYCSNNQSNWSYYLPMGEYAQNILTHFSGSHHSSACWTNYHSCPERTIRCPSGQWMDKEEQPILGNGMSASNEPSADRDPRFVTLSALLSQLARKMHCHTTRGRPTPNSHPLHIMLYKPCILC